MLLVIADDDRDAAETLAELLRLLVAPPVDVVLAFDGRAALATATGGEPVPDAVILDIEMPRMDGINTALGIRHALGSEAPTLIAVTGHAGIAPLAQGSGAFDHLLAKPLRIEQLVALLHSL